MTEAAAAAAAAAAKKRLLPLERIETNWNEKKVVVESHKNNLFCSIRATTCIKPKHLS